MKKMKKIAALVLALSMLSACNGTEETPGVTTPAAPTGDSVTGGQTQGNDSTQAPPDDGITISPSKNGYALKYNDYEIVMGSLADDLLAALGEPQDVYEEESCAFYGIDYMYYYPGLQINTFSPGDGEKDYILAVLFLDDTVTTTEGAYLGMSQAEVEDIYGEPTDSGDIRVQYIKDGMSLSFIFNDDELNEINYYYDAAEEFEII